MNFTDKQKKAIYTDNKNILVSAAAGSGKTSVLAERITRLILEGADIRRMLVCTFTSLAAGEMRERISKRLNEIADEKGSVRLRAQAEYVAGADVCTIHSFCLKLIKEEYLELGIPSLKIASEQVENTLKNRALDEAFEEMAEAENESYLRLAERYVKKTESDFKQLLFEIYEFLDTMQDGLEWIKNLDSTEAYNKLKNLFYELILSKIEVFVEFTGLYRNISIENGWENQLENDEIEFEAAENLLETHKNRGDLKAALAQIPHPYPRKKSKLQPAESSELFSVFRDNAKKIFKEIESLAEKNNEMLLEKDEEYMLLQAEDFYNILTVFNRKYSELKIKKGVATFNDILRYAYNALSVDSIADEWKKRYDYIFVDEYQDTNPIQDAIITKISKNDNLFMVGDIKQSIYKFRLAEPLIFRNKQDEYEGKSEKVTLVRMNDNFRSSAGVTDKINIAMKRLMSRDFGDIDYTDEEALIANSNVPGKTELIITNIDDSKKAFEADAAAVARKIAELHGEGYKYGDIVIILTNANKKGYIYRNALDNLGIPNSSATGSSLNIEQELFVNMLRVIEGTSSDIALLSVMRSYVGGFDERELAEIRSGYPKESFFNALYSCTEGELGKKCCDFISSIEKLRLMERTMEPSRFLILLKNQTLFEEMIRVKQNGKQKAEEFMRFFDECIAQAEAGTGIYELISYYDELKRNGEDYISKEKESGAVDDKVRIMTVHKSKGLEFPVVFFSGLHYGPNKNNISRKKVLYNSYLGIITDTNDEKNRILRKNALKDVIKDKQIKDDKSERLRVCYVAMTRAKELLYLTGAIKDAEKQMNVTALLTKKAAVSYESPMDWFLWAFGAGKNNPDIPVTLNNNLSEENAEEKMTDLQEILAKAALCEANGFDKIDALKLPLKVSVTSLLPEYIVPTESQTNLHEEKDEKSGGGAKLGTLIHLFMEHADFREFEGVEEQADRMLMSRLITENEKNDILKFGRKIEFFMNGPVAKRIAAADRIMKEVPFNISITASEIGYNSEEKIMVQGIIDLLIFEKDGITVVDYKSNYAPEDKLREIVDHYREQMRIYTRAIELITDKPVLGSVLCFLRSGKNVAIK